MSWTNDAHLQMSDAYCAWTLTHGDPNVQIAVVDEPVNPYHDDFKDLNGAYKVTVKTSNPLPTHNSHGTRVTGFICGQSNNGVNNASIGYNLKVNHYGVNNLLEYIPLIWQAYIDGNKVINCSFYISQYTDLNSIDKAMIAEITSSGCTIVAGGGNENSPGQQGLWDMPGVVIVGGIGQDNNHSTPSTNGIKTANHPGIDLCALANNATTLDVMSGSYVSRGGWGTSAATPQVTATVGLMLSVNPCLTPAEIEGILKSTTDPIDDAASYSGTIGTGRLNAYKAVLRAQQWGKEDLTLVAGEEMTIENVSYYKNIVVNTGATLTIRNTTLFIAKDGRINVDVGGRLNVVKSTIRAREPFAGCHFARYQWDGIAVAGNKAANQIPVTNQGYVFVDRSTIQDAKNAVSTYLIDLSTKNIIWSKTGGGIIKTTKSTFKDNGRHIEFYGYQQAKNANNISSFDETVFEYNGSVDVASGNRAYYMITAYGVSGVKFTGCTFANTNGSYRADQYGFDRGTGIYVVDASFIITDKRDNMTCATIKAGSFYDLTNGVQIVYSPSATLAHRIRKQNFDRNDRGVWLSNGIATSIDHNVFNLSVPANYWNRAHSVNDMSYKTGIMGVYAPGASGYKIEENQFTNLGGKTNGQIIAAFVAVDGDNNGGGGHFRFNTVDNTNIGSQTQRRNKSLLISCNDFKNTQKAFQFNLLSPNYETPSFGVCSYDWQVSKDYQNTFFTNELDGYHTIQPGYVNITNYKTYLVISGAPNRPDPAKLFQVKPTSCQNRPGMSVGYIGCNPLEELKDPCATSWDKDFNNYKIKYGIGKQGYFDFLQRLDDGAGSDLLGFVQQGLNFPSQDLYDALVAHSPYLSDEILITMLSVSTHLSDEQISSILILNSGLSEEVFAAVNARGLADEFMELVTQAQDENEPAVITRQKELDNYYTQMVNLKNDVIWAANLLRMDQSEETSQEDLIDYTSLLIEFLEGEDDLDSKKQLVSTYYLAGRLNDASNLLQTLPSDNDENIGFQSYYSLMINARLDGRDIYSLSNDEWETLSSLSVMETSASESAKGILALVQGLYFDAMIERGNSEEGLMQWTTGLNDLQTIKEAVKLIVFPNPANDKLNIKYLSRQMTTKGNIRIIDIRGKVVFEKSVKNLQGSIELNDINGLNGMYFVQLISNNVIIGTEKVIINK